MSMSELDLLADIGDFGPDPGAFGAGAPVVRCQVCAVDLDGETGAPLGPVDESNVRAVEDYVRGIGPAIQGGQPLDIGPDPFGGQPLL